MHLGRYRFHQADLNQDRVPSNGRDIDANSRGKRVERRVNVPLVGALTALTAYIFGPAQNADNRGLTFVVVDVVPS